MSWSLTCFSFARTRLEMVIRLSQKPPLLPFPQICVKPKKSKGVRLPEKLGCSVVGGEPPELDQPRLVGMQLQAELREPLTEIADELLGVAKILEPDDEVSGRGESHPSALAELCRNLSAHTAPIVQPSGRTPSRQCANSFGSRLATLTSHRLARRSWRCNRLYFRLAHRTR